MSTADNHDSRAALRESGRCTPWLSDRELARAAAAGDLEAFAALYVRHHRLVYRFARGLTSSADAAQDITQEVFVRLLVGLAGRYDAARGAFPTYLFGIVRNLSRARIRRDTRLSSLDAMPESLAQLDEPHRQLQAAETAVAVRDVLRRLPAAFREVLLLCDLHELSYEEAARVAGTSVGAVRSRLHRGRRLVREQLAHVAPAGTRHSLRRARS